MNAVTENWLPALTSARLASPMQELTSRVIGESRSRTIKQVMLVGATRGVGTSFVAVNGATYLAPAFGRVLLIEVVPAPVSPTETSDALTALAETAPVATIKVSQQTLFALIGRGHAAVPADWLQDFGLILWDVPPLSASPVALALAGSVDAVALIVQAHKTRRLVARHTAQRLQDSGGRMLGVVLNRAPRFIPGWIYRLL